MRSPVELPGDLRVENNNPSNLAQQSTVAQHSAKALGKLPVES